MGGQLFYSTRPLFVFIVISVVLMAMAVVGFLIGRGAGRRNGSHVQSTGVQASILGMLSLMLGFTFGVASARYDTRRVLVIDEANAIGTTFLRAQTLPEPYRTNLSNMLRRYVDVRLQIAEELNNPERLKKLKQDIGSLQQAMWKQTAAVAKEHPNYITGLFEDSLNSTIDLYSSTTATFIARVPNPIMWILAIIAVVSLGIVGYGFGFAGEKHWLIMALLSVIVALVIVMIVDLDRPEAGPTRISHQSMINLKKSLTGFEVKGR